MSNNAALTDLDLRNNSLSPAGGAAIGAMISRNRALKRLDLRWNNIGMSGGKAIADALRGNETMIEVAFLSVCLSGHSANKNAI